MGSFIAAGISAILTSIGSALSNKFVSSVVNITLFSGIFLIVIPLIWNTFNFPVVSFPDGFLNVFSGVGYIYYIVGYFIDIKFILSCLFIVLILRHAQLFVSIFNFIVGKVLSIFSSK